MDSKPTRTMQPRDENAISLFPRRSLHSRTKSSPSLSDLARTGASRNPSSRALGDISQTTRANRLVAGSFAPTKAEEEKENTTAGKQDEKPAGLPQTSLTSSNGDNAQVFRPRRVISRRATTIFRDHSTLPEVAETSVPEETHQEDVASQVAQIQEPEVTANDNHSLEELSNGLSHSHEASPNSTTSNELLPLPEQFTFTNVSLAYSVLESNNQQTQSLLTSAINNNSEVTENQNEFVVENYENFPFVPITNEENNTIELFATEERELNGDEDYVTAKSSHGDTESIVGEHWVTSLVPEQSDCAHYELETARFSVAALQTPEDIQSERWDMSMVSEYKEEIFVYYRKVEIQLAPNPNYMNTQPEINWSMRSVLIDWVVQVHERFQLFPETLYLTINIIDRFLSIKVVSINKLQLVGATALWIAGKYEEVNGPSLKEIIYMVDNSYEEEEILKAERFMLILLKFELGWPGPMSFLRRISTADDYDLETRTVAKYFLELTIMDEKFIECPPSLLAAGAHCLSRMMLNKGCWTFAHVHYSGYTYQQLFPLLESLLECLEAPQQHHSAIFDKYSDKKYHHAASFAQDELFRGFYLPDVQSNAAASVTDLGQRFHAATRQPRSLPTPPYHVARS